MHGGTDQHSSQAGADSYLHLIQPRVLGADLAYCAAAHILLAERRGATRSQINEGRPANASTETSLSSDVTAEASRKATW
eukprot:1061565-Rhodomonas_salina.4